MLNLDPSCLVSTAQAGGGGVTVWGIFSWQTLDPLAPTEHRLNAAATANMYLIKWLVSVEADEKTTAVKFLERDMLNKLALLPYMRENSWLT